MFQYIKHKDINFELWDECINSSKNGIIYALSWYLNITAPGWDAIIEEENGKYLVVMPVPVFKKFGIKYIKQPVLSQQLGIFGTNRNKIDSTIIDDIFILLKDHFWYIQKYEFNTENDFSIQSGLKDFKVQQFKTYHLDLNKPYKEIFKNYKTDRRWRINKAKRSNILIRESEDIDLLINIFHNNVAHKIYAIEGHNYEYKILRNLYRAAKSRGLAKLFSAETATGKVLAMGLFFNYNKKIIYIFNASTPEGKRVSAISLVVDSVLKSNAGKNLCFDFESPEIHQVAEFYRRFGSIETEFVSISYNNLPFLIKITKNIRLKLYRRYIKSPKDDG